MDENIVRLGLSASVNAPYQASEQAVAALSRLWDRSRKSRDQIATDLATADELVVQAVIYLTGGESDRFGTLPEQQEFLYCYRDGRGNAKFGVSTTPDGRVVGTWSNVLASIMDALTSGDFTGISRTMLAWVVGAASFHSAGGTGKFGN